MRSRVSHGLCYAGILVAISLCILRVQMARAQAGSFTKAQVADRIRKVEDGVDDFQKYLDSRGDDAKNRADSAQKHAVNVEIRPTPKTAGTKPIRQRTISETLWTI